MRKLLTVSFFTLALVSACVDTHAQRNYRYRSDVPAITTDGFYRIVLQPEVISLTQDGMADIRLFDERSKQVAFIPSSKLPLHRTVAFHAFRELADPAASDSTSSLVVENPGGAIGSMTLRLRNTNAERPLVILGSDDLRKWFVIREDLHIQASANSGDGIDEQELAFPASTYRYFRIVVNHAHRAGVALLEAGTYAEVNPQPVYTAIGKTTLTQAVNGNGTLVTVRLDRPNTVDKLELTVDGPAYFSRQLRIYAGSGNDRRLVHDTILRSGGDGVIRIHARTGTLSLEFNNGDNEPLRLTRATCWQLERSIVSWLDKKHRYHLLFGDSLAHAADYDLWQFTDSLPAVLPVARHERIIANPDYRSRTSELQSWHPWMTWAALAAVLLVLTSLTVRMTRTVNRESDRRDA